MGWIYLEHKETGGTTSVLDEPGVLEWHEAHGWKQADEPGPVSFVPPKGDAPPAEEWVELEHPATGGTHEFPNNPEALEGAYEAGWQRPQPPKPVKKTASVKASAEPATDDSKGEGVTSSG